MKDQKIEPNDRFLIEGDFVMRRCVGNDFKEVWWVYEHDDYMSPDKLSGLEIIATVFKENEQKGIYGKYIIARSDGKRIDSEDEYFVLKLKGEGDQKHIEACRVAVLAYASEIKNHLPDLSKDLTEKWKQ